MLGRGLFSITILVISALAADHNTFKDCSRVSFCTILRGWIPDDTQRFDITNLEVNIVDDVLRLNVESNEGKKLLLKLSVLGDNKFRTVIEEDDEHRYKLTEVLDGEPAKKTISFTDLDADNNKLTVAESEDSPSKVVIHKSPFQIEFYQNDVLEVVIDGTRIIMENFDDNQSFKFNVKFPGAVQIYGIHEHADKLGLRNTSPELQDPYRLRNLDVSFYELDSPMSLYGAVPVLYGHGTKSTSGVFLHNAAEQWIEIENNDDASNGSFMVERGTLDLFILLGPTPTEVVRQYTSLTGKAHLPQIWALGYHQCRWNYDNSSDVRNVVSNFDSHNFPLDVIWLDIEYTDGKKYFTWNPDTFADHVEMQNDIAATNRKLVTIIDPHIKVDDSYPVYAGAKENDLFVKNPDGSNFEGDCWPGLSSYMDFLNPAARDYYASWYSYDNFAGSTETLAGIWNDMNEPSVFDESIEKTLPGNSVHYGGVQHGDIHNIYGFLHTKSTHQGLLQRDNGEKRPFVLTRSHFAGTQRYSAIWTGDNTADWGYLAVSYSECLNANMLGIVFCGADVGGFFNDPDTELLQRWYQAAAWTPFYREHANMGTPRREPYLYSEDVQNVIRNAIQLRYKHLPVWYTVFYEHTRTGDPVIRPLLYHYPTDSEVNQIDNQLLLGSDIMVRAVSEPGVQSVSVYFPGDELWYSLNSADIIFGPSRQDIPVDINSIPVYYRGGSIIPRKDTPKPTTYDMKDDCYNLEIHLNKILGASGRIYVDDLTSFKYKDNLEYGYVEILYDENTKLLEFIKIDDDAVSDNYNINICQATVKKPSSATNNYVGSYVEEVYTMTQGGKLSEFKINLNQNTTVKLFN